MRIEIIPAHNFCNFPPWWGPHLQYELTSCWVNPKVITHKAGQLIFWAKNNWKRRLLGYHRFFLNEFIPFGWCFIKWLIFSTVYWSILLVKLKLNDFQSSLNWRWENDQNILKSQERHPGHKDTSKCLQTMPTLVLDLESSSKCCYLALVERLLDQWGKLRHSLYSKQMYTFLLTNER